MTTAKSIPGLLRKLADAIECTLGGATHAAQTGTQRRDALCQRNAAALDAAFATPVVYSLPPPNIARHHIVLIMSAELHSHHMQKIEAMADELENSFHYLNRYGLCTQAIQIESHGLGELLIQLLNRKGVTAQSLATRFEPFAYGRHRGETDASRAQQQHGGPCAPNQKPRHPGPQQ